MKTRIFLAGLCGLLAVSIARAQDQAEPAANTETLQPIPAGAAPPFSGRINDVVTLVQSGVDESVVLSYIKTSPGPFNADANEIVKVRDAGVSPTVLNAMLQRGNGLRQQEVQNQPQVAAATYTPPTTQVIVGSVAPTYVQPVYVQPAPVSSVVYIGGGSSYASYQRLSPYWAFPRPSCSYSTRYYGNYYGGCAPRFSVNACYGGGFHGGFGGYRGFHR